MRFAVLAVAVVVGLACSDKTTPRGPGDSRAAGGGPRRGAMAGLRESVVPPPRAVAASNDVPRDAAAEPPRATGPALLPDGPARVLKSMYDAARRTDGTSLRPFFTKGSAELIERLAKVVSGKPDSKEEDPWRDMRQDVMRGELPRIVREEAVGDKGTVWVREGGGAENALTFAKEDGAWKLDFSEAIKAELRDLPKALGKANDLLRNLPRESEKMEDVLKRAETEATKKARAPDSADDAGE